MNFNRVFQKKPSRIDFRGRVHLTNSWQSVCFEVLEDIFSSDDVNGENIKNKELPSTGKFLCVDNRKSPYDIRMSNNLMFSGSLSENEYAYSCLDLCRTYKITPFELSIEYVEEQTVINVFQKDNTEQASDQVFAPKEPIVEQEECLDIDEIPDHSREESDKSVTMRFIYSGVQDGEKLKNNIEVSKITRNLAKVILKKSALFSGRPCFYGCSFAGNDGKIEATATFVVLKDENIVPAGTNIDLSMVEAVCLRKNQMVCFPYFKRNNIIVFNESGEKI